MVSHNQLFRKSEMPKYKNAAEVFNTLSPLSDTCPISMGNGRNFYIQKFSVSSIPEIAMNQGEIGIKGEAFIRPATDKIKLLEGLCVFERMNWLLQFPSIPMTYNDKTLLQLTSISLRDSWEKSADSYGFSLSNDGDYLFINFEGFLFSRGMFTDQQLKDMEERR